MGANQEIELKFELEGDETARRNLCDELERRFGPGKAVNLTSTYFDTADLALREAAISLRIRKSGRRRLQTVKAPAPPRASAFARAEWEREIKGDAPDLTLLGETPLAALLDARRSASALSPAFQSIIRRTTWDVVQAEGAFELALDHGEVRADGRSARVCELEVELKSGAPASLLRLARSLEDVAPLRLAGRTKADRGYELIERTHEAVAHAEPPRLRASMSAKEGFQVIARGCIRHFLLNEPLLMRHGGAEALHQTRVALRRMRSAIATFRPLLKDAESAAIGARLRAQAQALGPARNLDVYIEGLGDSQDAETAALRQAAEAARLQAYKTALAAMAAPDARRLMFDLAIWVEAGAWLTAGEDRSLAAFAQAAVKKRWTALRRRGQGLAEQSPPERHAVRIQAKKLRYALEFLTLAAPDKAARRRWRGLAEQAKALQQALGGLNDQVQAEAILRTLLQTPGADAAALALAGGRRLGRDAAEAPRLLKTATQAYRRIADARP